MNKNSGERAGQSRHKRCESDKKGLRGTILRQGTYSRLGLNSLPAAYSMWWLKKT